MRKIILLVLVSSSTAFAGYHYGTVRAERLAANDEFTAQMYEGDEDGRTQEAQSSGNEKAFMKGFDYAVKQADGILNGGN